MKSVYKVSTLAAVLAASTSGLMADPVESSLDSAFGNLEESIPGKFSINARLRYESFDLDNGNPASDRDGTSIRVRYGYKTPDFSGFTAMVEGETLSRVGGEPADIHPADDAGDGTDLNQLWVAYKHEDFGNVKLGRQVYTLDDHRFIGHVGWRQNIQSFDALTAAYTATDKLVFNGFFIDEVHNVAGAHNDLDALGLNASVAFCKALKLTAFMYNIEGEDVVAQSSDTIGLRATGSFAVEDVTFNYAFSIAQQEDNSESPTSYDADYFAGDLSANIAGFTLGAGFEVLESGFRTPLATLHKFNGFADVFLGASGTGIANGLEDVYAYAGYSIPLGEKKSIPVKVIYHSFSPETGSGDYGDEIDIVASYQINKYLSLIGKYGSYDSDGGSGGVGGVDKDMFTFEMNFVY
ncbi:MAG: alginate export family protein [Opitutaceae bacterium]